MTAFVPSMQLCRGFFQEAVQPILERSFPRLRYSAAVIGSGSEVIGCDDRRSADHHYGPRVMLFVDPGQESCRSAIDHALREQLPVSYGGYSTSFSDPDPTDNGVRRLRPIESGPVNHMIELLTIRPWFLAYLGWDVEQPPTPALWLSLSQQKLLTIASGGVFRDDLGLDNLRGRLAWYPHDVWLYLLTAGWTRIGQEEHLMGRAGEVGDELGSALIAGRLVRDVMNLCFLMARRYAPYPKWFGTHFARLPIGSTLVPILRQAQMAATWQERESSLSRAFRILAEEHNRLGLTQPMETNVSPFFGRPFQVIWGGRFAQALKGRITDPTIQALADRTMIGGIDQISDNTDLLSNAEHVSAIQGLYRLS